MGKQSTGGDYPKNTKKDNEANKQPVIEKIKKLKQTMLNELTRISSQSCDTPDKAIEQRIRLEQISVEITHLEELLK